MATIQDAEQAATQMLEQSWWGEHSLPVDPFALAQGLGIAVRSTRLRSDESGNIVIAPEGAVITINQADHPNRQRFTCAHEIGHYLRRAAQGDRETYVDLRSTLAGLGVDSEEIYANQFAAALLMPAAHVRRFVDAGLNPQDVASIFGTSVQAVELRLRNLRIPRHPIRV